MLLALYILQQCHQILINIESEQRGKNNCPWNYCELLSAMYL